MWIHFKLKFIKIYENEAHMKWLSRIIYMNTAEETMRCREMKCVKENRIYERDFF